MEIYGSDLRPLKIEYMKDRLSKFDQPLNQPQYVKFVMLQWFMDQRLEVQLYDMDLPLFWDLNSAPWRDTNHYKVNLTSEDPSIPDYSMKLTFEENKAEHLITATLKNGEVQAQATVNLETIPMYDPEAEPRTDDCDAEVITAIVHECQVFLDKIINPLRVGEESYKKSLETFQPEFNL